MHTEPFSELHSVDCTLVDVLLTMSLQGSGMVGRSVLDRDCQHLQCLQRGFLAIDASVLDAVDGLGVHVEKEVVRVLEVRRLRRNAFSLGIIHEKDATWS